ncbi:MAG: ribose 5-phosphate isomerase B [Candidatus Omnitrophica bacterium]|nr:ribose 5-phosphate isomerase B [Candidatus Omnitrophota bacterium]
MRIAIGADHGGFRLKLELARFLEGLGHKVRDFGTHTDESCDYPGFAARVAKAVSGGRYKRGVLVCKTGIGMAIAANKIKGIRAAVIHDVESAISSREHNDCNVIVFGSRFVTVTAAKKILEAWLKTAAAGGRHRRRVNQIRKLEASKK